LRVMYGCSRMDKIFYCGKANVTKLERIGIDVEVESEDDKQLLMQQGLEKGWVTDHLGLIAEFAVSGADDKEGELGNSGARV